MNNQLIELETIIDNQQRMLDRCLALITACDNKASFVLAIDGIMLGFTMDKMVTIKEKICIFEGNYQRLAIIFTLFVISAILLLIAILPRINFKKRSFIIKNVISMSNRRSYSDDLLSQIIINNRIYYCKCCCLCCGCGLMLLGMFSCLFAF